MKKGLTNVIFVLDKSGSMFGLESDTIGGFNSMLSKQKRISDEAILSLILFNDDIEIVYQNTPIDNVKDLTIRDYQTGGCTALLDAIGITISKIENFYQKLSKEELPEKTVVIIITDGYENASREYSLSQIKSLVERKKLKNNWEFIFLGANIDAINTAESFGINSNRAANFHNDSRGIQANFGALSEAIASTRFGNSIDDSWKDEIDKDFKNRK